MSITENITTDHRFKYLINDINLSNENLGELIRYPYKSIITYYSDLTKYDYPSLKKIEENNILLFYNAFRIAIGAGSDEETRLFSKYIEFEPLRSAVLTARLEINPQNKYISFVKNACKILLTTKQKEYYGLIDPINVRVTGSMPIFMFKSKKNADKWFNDFIDCKLLIFEKLVTNGVLNDLFPIMATSIAYSLYFFSPEKYCIPNNLSENDAVYLVLQKFLTNTK